MAETIQDRIEENAKGVQSVSVDGMTTTAVDIDKQIRADEYLARKNAAQKNHCGLTFRQMRPGGCG
jgi:hypothetical protein